MTKKYVTELQGICVIEIYYPHLKKPLERCFIYLNESGLFASIYRVSIISDNETFEGYFHIADNLDIYSLANFENKCKRKFGSNLEFKIKFFNEVE